ncbi:hypothetical protein BH11PLA2_BH11PLA2_29790 [soil metagenome]
MKRAFAAVQKLTGTEAWDDIAQRRREDILVYLALSRFRKRPAISSLPRPLQRDMKAFFGAYNKACTEADSLLFKAGDASAVDEACKRATVGKLLPDDLYVHKSAVNPTTQAKTNFVLELPPGRVVEHGWLEGWSYHSGDQIAVSNNDYEPITISVK